MTMVGTCCASRHSHAATQWAMLHFGAADLGDRRRTRRLTLLAATLMEQPHMSLPKQFPHWSDLVGAYRLLSNDQVDPQAITRPHVAGTRQAAQAHPVVLCVQDDSCLDYTCRSATKGLGIIGDGLGQGLVQHAALAVLPDKRLLGILDLVWLAVEPVPEQETVRQMQARPTVRDVWHEAAGRIGRWAPGARLVHVGDRHADTFRLMHEVRKLGHDYVFRAMHDRPVDGAREHLWSKLAGQPSWGTITATLGAQRDQRSRLTRGGRQAELTIRVAPITVAPPVHDPRTHAAPPLPMWAVYLREENPPAGVEAVEWMLLTSLETACLEQARTIIGYYLCRWVIEEWHRCLKEGCRAEQSQLDDALDIQRLTGVLAIVAVRLLQVRDLAEGDGPAADSPAALQAVVPEMFVGIVAALAQSSPGRLTPRTFWRTVAQRGGYLGRKNDPRPGWKVLWRGWNDIVQMVRGAELYQEMLRRQEKCV